tara:strand:+ start:6327 stop:9806 length:3480 start_codon:yes stop_codon:yes gene_type:complete
MRGSAVNKLGKTERNKKIKEADCIFPFKYKWKTHDECVPTEKGDICATSVNEKGTLQTYGYCTEKTSPKKEHLKTGTEKKAPITKPKKLRIIKKIIDSKIKQEVKSKSKNKTRKLMKKVKIPSDNPEITQEIISDKKSVRLNEDFAKILGEFERLLSLRGEFFRARAYKVAKETVMMYTDNISELSELKGKRGIGETIYNKLDEFMKTGKIRALEKERANPTIVFSEIYGVGPKKAKELVDKHGVKTIEELKGRQDDLLNDKQKLGLKYYEDILKRIPRAEIEEYDQKLNQVFNEVIEENPELKGAKFQIVGSYRRGAKDSGDIDLIISHPSDNKAIFKEFIDKLIEENVVVDVLSRGQVKSLAVSQLSGKPARRIDFLYTPQQEFAAALLYFTGSASFNTVMRQRALDLGYTLNEHGFHVMIQKKKGAKLEKEFKTEKDIFDFLGMKFKEPHERIDGRSVVLQEDPDKVKHSIITAMQQPVSETSTPKQRTLKKRKIKVINPKEQLLRFQKSGVSVLEKLTEKTLADMVRVANDLYYNGTPVLDDNSYDILKEFVERKYPKNEVIKEVGAPVEKNKVELPYFMGSMDKIKPDTKALSSWKRKYLGPYVISAKLDGISGMYSTEGDEPKLYTRGNGRVGQDISYMIPYLKLPTEPGLVIRGELIIKRSTFNKKYAKTMANSRNFVSGVVNAKKSAKSKYTDIDFVGYEMIKPELSPSQQMTKMEEFQSKGELITVRNETRETIQNEELSELLVEWRTSESDLKDYKKTPYDYEIDGIIVADDKIYPRKEGNPKHAFAFKMVLSDQVVEAKVLDVIWTPSKDGYLKPRIKIEPVNIGGATIEYATAFNGAFVEEHKIGIGAIIQLVRSGDVIPHIMGVLTPAAEAKMPSVPYEWNDTHVDVLLKDAKANSIVIQKNIIGFFTGLEVVGLAEGNVQKIMRAGYDSVPKIIRMTKDDFLKVDGFKETMATKISNSIKTKLEEVSLAKLMSITNLFGRGMGVRRITLILKNIPDVLEINTEAAQEKEALINRITQIEGFAKKTAGHFVDHIQKFLEFIKETGLEHKLKAEKSKSAKKDSKTGSTVKSELADKKIVLTGFRDKKLMKDIEDREGVISGSVSKKTFAVICKTKEDCDDGGSKIDKAKKLGVPVLAKDEFESKYLQ